MSRFNTHSTGSKVINKAGGQGYSQTPELELLSILLTSFANDQFYRSADKTFIRLQELIEKCDKKFAAKAAVYARTEFGMRSITHVLASELAKHISGETWASEFYNKIVYRPDDMMEILSYHKNNGKVTNAMKKGFSKAFGKYDAYQLAKYRGESKSFKLVDVVRLVHPVPNERNSEALNSLIKGELKSFDTWETELTKAGQVSTSDENKAELKKEAWIKLIRENKLGYFALLRNLRNIIEQAPEVLNEALETLTNEEIIRKSLVLPFRFTTAYKEIQNVDAGKHSRNVLIALNTALDMSVKNVPVFDGDTVVVLDESGSMMGKPAEIGALFSAVLVKSNNADLMTFANNAEYRNVNPMDSTITIANSISFGFGGTNFQSIFETMKRKYDRVIILSDMQGWIGYHSPMKQFNDWKQRTGANPYVYSFDLNSYGSMQIPEQNVYCLAGFSEKVFDIMQLLERDKHALKNAVEKIDF